MFFPFYFFVFDLFACRPLSIEHGNQNQKHSKFSTSARETLFLTSKIQLKFSYFVFYFVIKEMVHGLVWSIQLWMKLESWEGDHK